jgi:UTP--glucose-1-phosphate uridylyltransferase
MTVTTAIIFAAGYGTRMLPITAAVEKELLPILDRPIIDYVVSDCIAAGITRIIFVIQPGSHGLRDYYAGNPGLEHALRRLGKTAALESLDAIHRRATFEFVEQPETAGYGTAVPLGIAAPLLAPDEAFLVCDGDAFSWHANGASETAALIRTLDSDPEAIGALATLYMPDDQLSRYGVVGLEKRAGREYLSKFVEKPAPGQAPSNLINISKYVLTPQILPYLQQVTPNAATGELYLTDAILAAAGEHPVLVHRAQGEFLDAGSVSGWLRANFTVALANTDVASVIPPQKLQK